MGAIVIGTVAPYGMYRRWKGTAPARGETAAITEGASTSDREERVTGYELNAVVEALLGLPLGREIWAVSDETKEELMERLVATWPRDLQKMEDDWRAAVT